ncbi:MAG: arylsulfatase [Opitutaceae bacterium]|nr:arylsulfatase [Opitutaceae bacterium]
MNPLFRHLFAAALAILANTSPGASGTRPPNIVVLLADDQGWADLGIDGNTQARTPNIDAFARSGARFDRFFVCPVCAPTRAEFLTGRYYPRTGVAGVDSGLERLNVGEKTIGDTLKAAGYSTGLFGKWHNGGQGPYHPNARGFDEFYGFIGGHWGWYFNAPMEHNGRSVRGRGYIADDITDHALAFMQAHRGSPFLCYLAFNTPHSPFCVPDAYWEKWKDALLPLRSPDVSRENVMVTRSVLAMNENLDWNVGRVLKELELLGLGDDTIVVYFSDNGANSPRWNAGMKGRKTSTDEGGVRAPCFIRWPHRIAPGKLITEISGAIDLHPTLLQLAGVPNTGTKPLDGMDISPLLLGEPKTWPERMLFSYWNGRTSVRTQRFRLDDAGSLFDLGADPGQKNDLSASNEDCARQLRTAVAKWKREMFGENPIVAPRGGGPRPVVVDARPIPVGHPVHDATILPAGEGLPNGEVHRSNRFPNCAYFTNWTHVGDAMKWELDVLAAGTYEVAIEYTCAEPAGSTVEVSAGGAHLKAQIAPAWNPPLQESEDRVPRQESYLKEFRTLVLGTLPLERGRTTLALKATRIVGVQAADVFGLVLHRIPLEGKGPLE